MQQVALQVVFSDCRLKQLLPRCLIQLLSQAIEAFCVLQSSVKVLVRFLLQFCLNFLRFRYKYVHKRLVPQVFRNHKVKGLNADVRIDPYLILQDLSELLF